ncbi:PAS domain S-box protein [Halobacterium rubrum]|uniref:PAS domain S-box protein n=1 Tax=Halobacterium TaxID=2239 RepID=UPI001F2EA9FE|nr:MULTISPECIES: PAS domain S-box protein [Halobacterium]MDH5019249.1 PAS domain S-box protein [Halobacterium rubrum]
MDGGLHRTLVEESADVTTVIDSSGTISYVSPSVQGTLGYDPEDLVGETGYEYQHPDDRAAVADAIEALQSEDVRTQTVETRFRHADGSWCWIEATLQDRTGDEADIDGILVNSRDISERKRRERRHQELAEEYETLLETVDDGIFFLDVEPDGSGYTFRFERLNVTYEEQTGITTAEVKGKTPMEVFGDDLGAKLQANYHRCANARESITYQEEVPVETGARFWQTNLAPVLADGEVSQIVGITRNVTERVKRERQLRSRNKQLDEFASVVSHDIRNPLNIAQGRAELLGEECDSDHLAPIVAALDRMDDIVSDTLTLARQGQVVTDPEPVALADLLGVCWKHVPTGDDDSIEVVDDADEAVVHGDRSRLQHVFENLFRNAVEHGSTNPDSQARQDAVEHGSTASRTAGQSDNAVEHGGPGVTVRVGRVGDHGLYVEDTGSGIPEGDRQQVFEPGHTSASDGTGFGLTIVRRIAEAHGWTVDLTTGPKGGARFEFTDVEFE